MYMKCDQNKKKLIHLLSDLTFLFYFIRMSAMVYGIKIIILMNYAITVVQPK